VFRDCTTYNSLNQEMFTLPCDAEALAESSHLAPTHRFSTTESGSELDCESTDVPASGQSSTDGPSFLSRTASTPSSPREQFPSDGSALHLTGQCRPCGWFWKPEGCKNGTECGHCHLCEPGESKKRKRAKMAAAKRGNGLSKKDDPSQTVSLRLSHLLPREEPESTSRKSLAAPASSPPPYLPPFMTQHLMPVVPAPPVEPPNLTLLQESRFAPPAPNSSPTMAFSTGCSSAKARMGSVVDADELTMPISDPAKISLHKQIANAQLPELASQVSQSTSLVPSRVIQPSKGSALHASGRCSACAWFWKPSGCKNGVECGYCHLCPEGEIRRRRKMKNAALRAQDALDGGKAEPKAMLPHL